MNPNQPKIVFDMGLSPYHIMGLLLIENKLGWMNNINLLSIFVIFWAYLVNFQEVLKTQSVIHPFLNYAPQLSKS